jgi:hypothetical protein
MEILKFNFKKVVYNPYLMGTALGFFVIPFLWQWGQDAKLYYLRTPPTYSPVPQWIYLITTPFSFLGWPLSLQVWLLLTVLAVGILFGYNAWWGQIELLSILGLALGLMILEEELPDLWMGAVWLLMGAKLQVSWGLLLVITYWFWKKRGWRSFIPGIIFSGSIIAITYLVWPGWLSRWISTVRITGVGQANAAIFPYGLLALPLAFFPRPMPRLQRLRCVAAATLLSSPYFTLHHCLTLISLQDRPWVLAISWLPVIMIFTTRDWAQYSWVIPVVLISVEWFMLLRKARSEVHPAMGSAKRGSDAA